MDREDGNRSTSRSGNVGRRTISVSAMGEALCPPDLLQFIISVSSSKETVDAAQLSVRRRTEYILQVLRSNGINERCIKCSSEISRGESACMQTDILVQSDSLENIETVRNLLIEKLDPSVNFSPISYHHSQERKESKRKDAFRQAVVNAKSKAQSIAQTVGVQVGAATEVTELSHDAIPGSETGMELESEPDTNRPKFISLHDRFSNATLVFSSQVSVTFEVQPTRTCGHKKCPKH